MLKCTKSIFQFCQCRRRGTKSFWPISHITQGLQYKVLLCIGNISERCVIDLLTVPYCSIDYDFKATTFIENLSVTGFLTPTLHLSWPDLAITHKYAFISYNLPSSVSLTWLQGRKVKRILSQDNYVLLYIQDDQNTYRLLPLKDTIWANTATSDAPLMVAHSSRDRPPLYPSLHETSRL